MSQLFNTNNPGIGDTGGVTLEEGLILSNLASLVYSPGDILYINSSSEFQNLAVSTNGYVLTLVGGFPVWAAASGGSGGHVIEDEGTPLTQRANMNFVGSGVTVTDAGGKTVVTIPGGGGLANVVEDLTPQLGGDLDANGNDIINIPSLDFDITQTTDAALGEMRYDADMENFVFGVDSTSIPLNQPFYYVHNNTGATLTKGTPVYATGTVGASGRITVGKFIADGSIAGKYYLGVLHSDVLNGADGLALTQGTLRGLDTSAFTDGQVLYVSASVAGTFTATEPTSPNLSIATAFVIYAHATTGSIAVRATPGVVVDDISDITATATELNYTDGVTSSIQTQLNARELLSNKATDFTTVNDTLYPTVEAVQEYVTSAVVGLLDYRGTYDASTNLYPATGGSGLAGAILKGDFYIVSVAGTLGGTAVTAGDLVIALIDTPAQISSNWDIVSNELGYTPENAANKVTSISGASTDTQYPSAKLLYDQLLLKAAALGVDDNYVTDAEKVKLSNLSGTNSGDQTSIVGITGTKAQFDTAVTDGNFMYVGDAPTAHTHLLAAGATDVTITAANLNSLDDGVDSTLHFHATDRARANHTGSQLASTISDFASTVLATVLTGISFATGTAVTAADSILVAIGKLQKQNTDQDTAIALNTAKVTNATHTGEVTGSGALTVDKTAITNKTLVTAAVGDHILIADASDTDNLKKITVQTIVDLAGGGGTSFNDIYIDQSGGTSDTYGVLAGTINGSNALFTVSQALYATGTLKVYLNGQLMTQGTGEDFVETTPASGTFTFNTAPATGSLVTVEYQKVVTNSDTVLTTGDYQSAVVRVVHGAVAGTTRPAGATYVEWVGSVTPTNAVTDDTWVDNS